MRRASVAEEVLLQTRYDAGPKMRRHKAGIVECQFCHFPILPGRPSMNHGTFHARCYFEWINDLRTRR
jgi:hypothetical protein